MGEEWRRGWHPENIAPKKSAQEIMVIGAGPAGLEAARALGQRGYDVTLLEAHKEFGGRVLRESALPGLNEWRRVVDWRLTQIGKLKNISVYPSSPMTPAEILESGAQNIILATGSAWRCDGLGRTLSKPISGYDLTKVFSPDDLMNGKLPSGKVIIYDDDHYYMGGVLAELLASQGCEVVLVTPAPLVSYWSQYTLEQERIQRKLMKLGVEIHVQHILDSIHADSVRISSNITGNPIELENDAVVLVTDRISNDSLYEQLRPALAEGQLRSLRLIGDAEAPNIIAQAVFSGHLAAREFDEAPLDGTPFKVERMNL
jgi:dimethylamine/trimethylamine dehydrogenase